MSQAIARVLQDPAAARRVAAAESLRLAGDRGLDVLAELIEMAQSEPHLSSAQLVERWRDRPEYERLSELAALPLPELGPEAVGEELSAAVAKLAAEAGPARRLDALIAKAAMEELSEDEKRELRELQARPRPGG
ncbi:MAG: hypothetical protein JSR54_19105 [Proteobacteria bacterium]|nr:hypothetical protein [Pseudomonadota bacterium]